jgi:hypothetical protein
VSTLSGEYHRKKPRPLKSGVMLEKMVSKLDGLLPKSIFNTLDELYPTLSDNWIWATARQDVTP